jgi:hypothetical protein
MKFIETKKDSYARLEMILSSCPGYPNEDEHLQSMSFDGEKSILSIETTLNSIKFKDVKHVHISNFRPLSIVVDYKYVDRQPKFVNKQQ